MHKFSPSVLLILVSLLALGLTRPVLALDCPDFIAEDWDDKPTCAWIRNDTMETITITPWSIYQDSGDLNDDYWRGGDTVIPPGATRVVVGLDNDGWGWVNYDTVRGKSQIRIGAKPPEDFIYMEADINAGVVWDFEYSLDGTTWVDDEGDLPAHEIRNVGGTDYKFIVQDEWNFTRAAFDVFFTVSSQTTNKGNTGYLPPDTATDPKRINVMNFNTYLLLGPAAAASAKLDYCDRAQAIADNGDRIFANVDILVMEELASRDSACSPDALELAASTELCCAPGKPFRDRTYLLNGDPLVIGLFGPENTGGVVIMSRYPNSLSSLEENSGGYCDSICETGGGRDYVVDYEDDPASLPQHAEIHYVFRKSQDQCGGDDCLADKGFLRAKFTKSYDGVSQDYFIIGTHAQADAEYADERTNQFIAIEKHAASLPSDVPIIIVGDTNTEQGDEIRDMLTTLNAASDLPPLLDSHKGPLRFSEDYGINYYSLEQRDENDGKRDQYDWVLYSKHGLQPSSFKWQNLMVRDHEINGRADLSDHAAVLAEFSFHPATEKLLQDDNATFFDGQVSQTIIPIPDDGTVVKKVITADYPAGTSLIHALYRSSISHSSDGDLGVRLLYYPPEGGDPIGGNRCVPDQPEIDFYLSCDLEFSALINLEVLPWEPSGRWELEVHDGLQNGLTGSLDWLEITLNIAGLPGVTPDDTDGDGVANLDDRCPLDPNNTCNSGSQDTVLMSTVEQVTMFALQEGRQIGLITRPGSLAGDEAYFFAEHTSAGPPGYGMVIDQGAVLGIRSVMLNSAPDTSFGVPVTFRMTWPDQNDDGVVDGTTLQETQLRLAKDGAAVTGACEDESACDTEYDTFDYDMSSGGEFLLFVVLDSDQDGVADKFDGVVDNCPLVNNPAQDDADGNGVGDACEAPDPGCMPDSITLTSQAEVDNFQADHGPACTTVTGNLVISGADISSLAGLSAINGVGGYLRIEDNDILASLDGLSGLTGVVSQTIDYVDNQNQIIYHDLAIMNNPSLSDCSVFQELLDDVDTPLTGPGPGPAGIPDIGGTLAISGNLPGCNSFREIDTEFDDSFE